MAKNETEIKGLLFDTKRKTIWHLQKMKEKGEKIVQICPVHNDPLLPCFANMQALI